MATRDKPDKRLTPLETLIMNVLWDESPAAVKQVQERLTEPSSRWPTIPC